nr:MAG TPA: hypothetical protein [Bacteriophage sp.]
MSMNILQDCRINILGSEWNIKFGNEEQYPNLKNMDGYCDQSTREIIVDDMEKYQEQIDSKADLPSYRKQITRHEIIHAFLFESGLDISSVKAESWATNEEMVDWIAIQMPKIIAAMEKAGAL